MDMLALTLTAAGLFSAVVLPSGIIAIGCLAVAGLVIRIGEWKTKLGLLPRFASLAKPARYDRRKYRSLGIGKEGGANA